jgi:hypothetical protein
MLLQHLTVPLVGGKTVQALTGLELALTQAE